MCIDRKASKGRTNNYINILRNPTQKYTYKYNIACSGVRV